MIMGGKLLGSVEDFEMSKSNKWVSFLVYLSKLYVSFIGFELIYSFLICGKLIIMQVIIVHKI